MVMGLTHRQHVLAEQYGKVTHHYGRFEKLTGPDSCDYVAAEDNDKAEDGKKCGHCVAFRGGGGCHWVAGEIEVGGLCRYWVIAADNLVGVEAEPTVDDQIADEQDEDGSGTQGKRSEQRPSPAKRESNKLSGSNDHQGHSYEKPAPGIE